jgi:uncharacterized ion transporter superfamily protein YfcC
VVAGAQSFLSIAFVIAIARGLSLILTSSGFADVLAHGVAHVLRFNNIAGIIILFFAFLLISIFIPSTSGFAYTIYGPLIAPAMSVATTTYHVSYSLAGGIASASMANGLINLASPTAGVFVIGCEMAKVPLKHFYKSA